MDALVACEHCDWLHQERALRAHEKALCVRCGGVLYRAWPDSLRRTFALSVAALALLVVANVYPFLSFTLEGQTSVNRIVSGVFLLWQAGYAPLALLILFSSVLAPAAQVGMSLYITGPLLLGHLPPGLARVTRFQLALRPWAMLEVYMLALLATLAKLASMATVEPKVGAWAFVALIGVSTAAMSAFDPRVVWRRLEAAG